MGARTPLFCRRNDPTALADAPKEINTAENPATKASEDPKSPERGNSPLRSCSMPIPDNIEMYPGTSGKTQGDKNETRPARNAPASETSLIRQRSFEVRSSRTPVRCPAKHTGNKLHSPINALDALVLQRVRARS